MRILVCYDVRTDSPAGAKRLRRVAKACEGAGQRVQKSVFECVVTEAQYEGFVARVLAEIDAAADSLRVYRLPADLDASRAVFGVSEDVDFEGPLVV